MADALLARGRERTPAPSDALLVPAQIGSYRIVRLLGRGGMGAVYEAEQAAPIRKVALKELGSL
ncbi:MAG: hypothetical protein AAF628_34550 [Planctomycetota bacterium]